MLNFFQIKLQKYFKFITFAQYVCKKFYNQPIYRHFKRYC